MTKSRYLFCGLWIALTVWAGSALGQTTRDGDCFEVALRAKNARIRAERALARSAIAAARVEAELQTSSGSKSHPSALEVKIPARAPTPGPGTADRQILVSAFERVNAVSPAVLQLSRSAQHAVDPAVTSEAKPPDGAQSSSQLSRLTCMEILSKIEDQVFDLEQAMQLAEVAADQAIGLAGRKGRQP